MRRVERPSPNHDDRNGASIDMLVLHYTGMKTAEGALEKLCDAAAKVFRDPITTEIVPLKKFWEAEGYHQDYFAKNPNAGYCQYVIAPKIRKLEHKLGK